MSKWACLSALLTIFLFNAQAWAWVSPVGLSLFPPIEIPPEDWSVVGLRAGIYSKHKSVYGIDLAVVAKTTENFVGSAIAIGNKNEGDATIFPLQLGLANGNHGTAQILGLQIGIANVNGGTSSVVGCQFALGFNHNISQETYGLQLAALWNGSLPWLHRRLALAYAAKVDPVLNTSDGSTIYGLEAALLWNTSKAIYGLQIGLVNVSQAVYGVQIGVVNYTESLHGIQLGLANINAGGLLPFFPVLNVGF